MGIVKSFLPFVLKHVKDSDLEIRRHAAYALLGYAAGKAAKPNAFCFAKIVTNFIQTEETSGGVKFVSLSEMFRHSITAGTEGVIWSFTIIISLLYLADSQSLGTEGTQFFGNAMWLLRSLPSTTDPFSNSLLLSGYRAFFWAFSRWHEKLPQGDPKKAARAKAFSLVFDKVPKTRPEFVILSVACMLNLRPRAPVTKALEMLVQVVKGDDQGAILVVSQLLFKMLCRPRQGTPEANQKGNSLVCKPLLDNHPEHDVSTRFLFWKPEKVVSDAASIMPPSPAVEHVRGLTEDEVVSNWAGICQLWQFVFDRCLARLDDIPVGNGPFKGRDAILTPPFPGSNVPSLARSYVVPFPTYSRQRQP